MKDLNFHYSREERLALNGAPDLSTRTKRGFLKNNRSLMILLVDIAIICLLFVIYRQFLFSPPYRQSFAGYTITLRGFPLQDKVIASLIVRKTKEEAFSGRIYIRFMVKEEDLRISEVLPKGLNAEVELTGSLLVSGAGEELVAEVQIGKERKTISRKLE